ncbi:MAG TPA: RNA polymerase sigma factor RpoD/SigA [Gemmataceae bacterium]|jgi:RNA polymerase primary sigma factor|nr:RNA polymerase sigma factor RpoD/SigA [Gemmataceae bacterium]
MQLEAPVARSRRQFKVSIVQTPLESYLGEINETRLLNAQQERELAERIGEGDGEARDHMVRANLRLVVNIARSYLGKGLPLQDLIAEGNLGLMRAVEGFDPTMNTRFSTYASYWIKQSIKRAVINTGKTIRIPAYMNELLVKWRRATLKLQDELGRTPTQEETAASLRLSKKKFAIIRKAIRIHNAGAQVEDDDHGQSIEEAFTDEKSFAPDASLALKDDLRQVLMLLDKMDKREAAVLRLRYGLTGEEPLTLKDIGDRLNLTRERVRQIEVEALRKLYEMIEG